MSSNTIPQIEVEPEGVNAGAIMGIIAFCCIALVVIVVATIALSGLRFQEAKMAATQETGYPLLYETRMNGVALLEDYVALDDDYYRIPIERAMELEIRDANEELPRSCQYYEISFLSCSSRRSRRVWPELRRLTFHWTLRGWAWSNDWVRCSPWKPASLIRTETTSSSESISAHRSRS